MTGQIEPHHQGTLLKTLHVIIEENRFSLSYVDRFKHPIAIKKALIQRNLELF